MMERTSCFFSSTLSETASLAAVRRVVAPALVWPFAISGGSCQRAADRGGRRERWLTLVALFGSSGHGALDALGGLVDGVPGEQVSNGVQATTKEVRGRRGSGSLDCFHFGLRRGDRYECVYLVSCFCV